MVVNSSKFHPIKVISGLPQGTVLGPYCFPIHIDDLHSLVTSQVRLFVDDCLMYCPICSIIGQVALQQDLAALDRWSDTRGMRLNAGKCLIIHTSCSHAPFMYHLCGQILFSVEQAQYIGANVSLGFLKRNLKHCPSRLLKMAYIVIVYSILEYAYPIWHPHLHRDVDLLEWVPRRMERFVHSDYQTPVV